MHFKIEYSSEFIRKYLSYNVRICPNIGALKAVIRNYPKRAGLYLLKEKHNDLFRESYQVFVYAPNGNIDKIKSDAFKVFNEQCLNIIEHDDYFIVGVR